jgi:hypothetical protein
VIGQLGRILLQAVGVGLLQGTGSPQVQLLTAGSTQIFVQVLAYEGMFDSVVEVSTLFALYHQLTREGVFKCLEDHLSL